MINLKNYVKSNNLSKFLHSFKSRINPVRRIFKLFSVKLKTKKSAS